MVIQLSGNTLPATPPKRIDLQVLAAGREFDQSFSPVTTNMTSTFTWDGKDAYGRMLEGPQDVTARIGYVYDAVYRGDIGVQKFNADEITLGPTREEVTLWTVVNGVLGSWTSKSLGLGGWSLNIQHAYDPVSHTLYLGDGGQRDGSGPDLTVAQTVAGSTSGDGGYSGDNGPAAQALLQYPHSVATGPDGSLYIAEVGNNRVRRVGTDGIITTVAGDGTYCVPPGCAGDGGPATKAQVGEVYWIAIGPDGSLYLQSGQVIRRVGPDGIINTFAGGGSTNCNQSVVGCCPQQTGPYGDGCPATQAVMAPTGMAVGPDGSLYIADSHAGRIRRVGTDGIINTVAGGGSGTCPAATDIYGDGCRATEATLSVSAVTVDAQGNIYIADGQGASVRKVGTDGIINRFAGGNGFCSVSTDPCGDGGPAIAAKLAGAATALATSPDGSLLIADFSDYRIRRVGPDRVITTVAGNGSTCGQGTCGEKGPATRATFYQPVGITVAPDGTMYVPDYQLNKVRSIASAIPGISTGDILLASRDGTELYDFSSSGRHLRTLDALTGVTRYQFGYDSAGHLTSVTDAAGNVTSIQRDASGNPTAIVAPGGQTTMLTVDANGYLATVADPLNNTYHLTNSADGLLQTFSDPNGHASQMTYDAMGRLTKDQDAAGGFTSLARTDANDGQGSFSVTLTTALGRTEMHQVTFLPAGDVQLARTGPDGKKTTSVVKTDGTTTTTYADGTVITTVSGPDPRWGMLAPVTSETIVTPGGPTHTRTETRTATLSDPNNPLSLTGAVETVTVNGNNWTSAYDKASQTITTRSPVGRQKTTSLDTLGRPIQDQTGSLSPWQYTYDSKGRLATVKQGSRTWSVSYDGSWHLTGYTDPLGQTQQLGYDAAGRVTSQTLPDGTSKATATYDAAGNMTSITPPGRPAHTFAYSPVDLLQTYTPPAVTGSGATQYSNNLDHQLTQTTLPGGSTIAPSYDSAGRPSSLTIARGSTGYTYDATTGLVSKLTAPDSGTTSYTYDGVLPTGMTWTGTVAGSVGASFNADLNISSRTVNGANPLSFGYDADGFLTSAGSETLSYDTTTGLITGTTLGSVSDADTYSPLGELSTYGATYSGTSLLSDTYALDGLGRISSVTESISGGASHTTAYTYDSDGRLTQVSVDGSATEQYTYDANGNRLTGPGSGASAATYDNQDRLLTYGTLSYTYTPNGELSQVTDSSTSKTTTFTHDTLGNLTGVTLPSGTTVGYILDGQNRRIGKTVNGTLQQGFLYSGDLHPVAELDGSNTVVSRFVYGSSNLVPDYMIKGGVIYRILTDTRGSPRLVVNTSTGQVVQRMDYTAYGKVTTDTNPGFQPFGFAGGLYDRDTGLLHFGARDYDPTTGRWVSKDPRGFAAGDTNLYAYVGNDPVNVVDPDGRDPFIKFDWPPTSFGPFKIDIKGWGDLKLGPFFLKLDDKPPDPQADAQSTAADNQKKRDSGGQCKSSPQSPGPKDPIGPNLPKPFGNGGDNQSKLPTDKDPYDPSNPNSPTSPQNPQDDVSKSVDKAKDNQSPQPAIPPKGIPIAPCYACVPTP